MCNKQTFKASQAVWNYICVIEFPQKDLNLLAASLDRFGSLLVIRDISPKVHPLISQDILQHITATSNCLHMFKCIFFVVAFSIFLRRNNLVLLTHKMFNLKQNMCWADVLFSPPGLEVIIRLIFRILRMTEMFRPHLGLNSLPWHQPSNKQKCDALSQH